MNQCDGTPLNFHNFSYLEMVISRIQNVRTRSASLAVARTAAISLGRRSLCAAASDHSTNAWRAEWTFDAWQKNTSCALRPSGMESPTTWRIH